MSKTKICLLFGGISNEREISILSANSVYEALDKNKYEVLKYDLRDDFKKFINDSIQKKFDLVLPILHGTFGEDGRLQGMLDILEMPYVFSNCLAHAIGMNKKKTKLLVENAGVNTADDVVLENDDIYNIDEIINKLNLPMVIKPNQSGSSVGISIAENKKEVEKGIKKAFENDSSIILEKFIKGRELTVPIFENNPPKALPVIEIIPKVSKWFDYEAKYKEGGSEEICPAQISDKIRDEIQNLALKAFKAIGCKDLARADFMLSEDNQLYFLEINTIPGMTKTSLVPQSAKQAGMSFTQFLDRLINMNICK